MDYIIILLATILIVVIAYMISTAVSTTTTMSKEVDMKDKTADISASSLTRPDATRYAYNVWVYMDKPVSGASDVAIFNRAEDLGVFINGATSTLTLKLKRKNTTTTYQITNNFPLQKWVLITISVDNSTIDMYLDGKLVKSVIDVSDINRHMPDATSPITFGVLPGTYMTKFSRVLSPSDPQTAWSLYMEGSGSKKGLSNLASRYNVNLSLIKDNVVANSFSLW
jgi:hypothetical protein